MLLWDTLTMFTFETNVTTMEENQGGRSTARKHKNEKFSEM